MVELGRGFAWPLCQRLTSCHGAQWPTASAPAAQPKLEETDSPETLSQSATSSRRDEGQTLISVVVSDRTRGNGRKLCQKWFGLAIRERLFTRRVVGDWNRLPKEAVRPPSLTELGKHLDNALRDML